MRLIVFIIFFTSCINTKINPAIESECNYNYIENNLFSKIISLRRGACFGKCPIYLINIFSDRSAVYHGEKFVEKIGTVNFQISLKEVNLILEKANEINYCQMENEYFERITDLPNTNIEIFDKKIKDYYGAPKELKELERLIDQICLKYIK